MKQIEHPSLPQPLSIPPDDGKFGRDDLIALYWRHHPRFRYLKMSPAKARFFDIGAGAGGLSFWRDWQSPLRPDIELHGCDLLPAEYGGRYAAFHVMNIDGARFSYPDAYFEAALSSHVIEHLRDQAGLAAELARLLKPGGMVYIETPTEESCHFPGRDFFIAHGFPTTTINFFDDRSHTTAVNHAQLRDLFVREKFMVQEAGTIKVPFLEDLLSAKAAATNDEELGSYGLWSKLGFAHYAIFKKPLA